MLMCTLYQTTTQTLFFLLYLSYYCYQACSSVFFRATQGDLIYLKMLLKQIILIPVCIFPLNTCLKQTFITKWALVENRIYSKTFSLGCTETIIDMARLQFVFLAVVLTVALIEGNVIQSSKYSCIYFLLFHVQQHFIVLM